MSQDKVVEFINQEEIEKDHLTELLRAGARRLICEAMEAELEGFMLEFKELKNDLGHQIVVRNGYLPEREIMTGIGPVNRKSTKSPGSKQIRNYNPRRFHWVVHFSSAFLPNYGPLTGTLFNRRLQTMGKRHKVCYLPFLQGWILLF